jgi:hypothetical protein
VLPVAERPTIRITRASYGVPGDEKRSRDVSNSVQALVNRGETSFQVSKLAEGGDPAFGTVKALVVEYTANGQAFTVSGQDPDTVDLSRLAPVPSRPAEVRCGAAGRLELVASQAGHYELTSASGRGRRADLDSVPAPQDITGAWDVSFPPQWGAPEKITLEHLISLSDSTNAGVKYFSGTATYTKTFAWKAALPARHEKSEIWLDLGDVQVMAQVKLNGHDLGILWKPPFRVNVTDALKRGRNVLQIRVADLWPNRMIGDAALPAAERLTWSSYEPFTRNTPLLKSGLLGPVKLQTAEIIALP